MLKPWKVLKPWKALKPWKVVLGSAAIAGCTGIPDGTQPVTGFELDRYLGQWYEIARLDHSFEEGLQCVTATYSLREDDGVRVINRGYNPEKQAWDEAEGRAYFIDDDDIGRLKVSFFGPFYGGYNILALDDDYQWALVSGPNRDYLWILSRTPDMDSELENRLRERAAELDFPTDELIDVAHGEICPER
ncbi:lipocalin family protein [Halomonas janggokensis]|uniref:Outer membrane lipoprotein Blc n=1 Tax=Vreelandella janggokensis TaxID=370767 RepID=A0ABT4IQ77_9GAMM|nr:lipocalin family protein [Halomonas janggokensis]MCZ0925827.1 lipocalin family protein [Halomonas janggokensis]MCZ0930894.1 lipocalin family protein [Halomonas janggokensis]